MLARIKAVSGIAVDSTFVDSSPAMGLEPCDRIVDVTEEQMSAEAALTSCIDSLVVAAVKLEYLDERAPVLEELKAGTLAHQEFVDAVLPGCDVKLTGLQSRPELNGRSGLVLRRRSKQGERFGVLVEGEGEAMALKLANLVLSPRGSYTGRRPASALSALFEGKGHLIASAAADSSPDADVSEEQCLRPAADEDLSERRSRAVRKGARRIAAARRRAEESSERGEGVPSAEEILSATAAKMKTLICDWAVSDEAVGVLCCRRTLGLLSASFRKRQKSVLVDERVMQALVDAMQAHAEGAAQASLLLTTVLNLMASGIGVGGVKWAESSHGLACKHALAEMGALDAAVAAMRRAGLSPADQAAQQRMSLNLISSICYGNDGRRGAGDAEGAAARRARAMEAGALEAAVEVIRLHLMLDPLDAGEGRPHENILTALRTLGRLCLGAEEAGATRRAGAVRAGAVEAIVRALDQHARRDTSGNGGFAELAPKAIPVLRLLCGPDAASGSAAGDDEDGSEYVWWKSPAYVAEVDAYPAVLAALQSQLAMNGPVQR